MKNNLNNIAFENKIEPIIITNIIVKYIPHRNTMFCLFNQAIMLIPFSWRISTNITIAITKIDDKSF